MNTKTKTVSESKRFITFIVYIVVTGFLSLTKMDLSVPPEQLIEFITFVVSLLLGFYTIEGSLETFVKDYFINKNENPEASNIDVEINAE